MKSIIELYKNSNLSKAEYIQKFYSFVDVLYDLSSRIKETEIKEIKITSDGVEFVHDEGFKLVGLRNEPRCSPHEILAFCHYEPFESFLIKLLTANADTIIDIGANIGHFTTQMLYHNKTAKIIAFEPVDTFRQILLKNILINGLGERCIVKDIALSSSNGQVDFFVPYKNGTNASLKNVSHSDNFRKLTVKTALLDDCILSKVDFIKIDVEGAEFEVLKGSQKVLTEYSPIIFMELLRKWSREFGYHPNDVIDFLKEFDYVCYAIGDNSLQCIEEVTDSTVHTNFIFCPEDKLSIIAYYVN